MIRSHPAEGEREAVPLSDHLDDVAARIPHVVPASVQTPAGESLRAVCETLALLHDFGKATSYFQQYLNDEYQGDSALRYHAPLGSFAAYYALDARGFDTETCLAGFVAVAKHHGELPNVATYVHDRTNTNDGNSETKVTESQRAVAKQLADIREHAPDLAADVFERASDGEGSWSEFTGEFVSLLDDIDATVTGDGAMPRVGRDALSVDCYGTVLRCWSALTLADKTSAAGAKRDAETYEPKRPRRDVFEAYVADIEKEADADPEGTREQRLDYHRSRARAEVLETTESFAEDGGGVATLTLPTGLGKTLTGLSAAFDLRERLGGERIVYALPFTSIIDQVVDELADIYETDGTGRLLTAHHHLAETVIRDDDDEERADKHDDIAGMLAESWLAGLTVTTFVQLFESLAGPANRQSLKLPALQDAVIVLDEPQSLPLDWWKLAPRLVELLIDRYDATVIAMTATQPRLFEDATELVAEPSSYFEAVERVEYVLDESTERYVERRSEATPKSYESAGGTLERTLDSGQSSLAICNTIDSARELTDQLSGNYVNVGKRYGELLDVEDEFTPEKIVKKVRRDGRPATLHLSTRLRPRDRLALIQAAKQLTDEGYPLTVVSTQLIEAGVDISFDTVYRDLAPIDSIVQAAGRCNRSFERERGEVTVWWLDAPGDQQKTPAAAIYNRGVSLLPVTAETLAAVRDDDGGTLPERAVADEAVSRYYRRLREEKNVGKAEYADHVDSARAAALGELSLIDARRTAEILVCRTDDDRRLAEKVRQAEQAREWTEFRRLLDESKDRRISVPLGWDDDRAEAIQQLPVLVEDEGLYCLDTDRYEAHFDTTQGFVVPGSSVAHQFL
ncbi:CRISPR-associated endonuclease Cas3'' [Halosegnis longus]|uniref:CRISPR-associated endonuclease Cas3'' n=1 Tax=Halosegnis longus TaxID=2216012 RepID=UPI00129E22F0|nr:CRISPR-associated endonuclease Cas3'' [Halosegnis longus]